jgi:glycerol-3-phosphate O-acyltransferase/dihydroxyacetone phosphate acyltransferase
VFPVFGYPQIDEKKKKKNFLSKTPSLFLPNYYYLHMPTLEKQGEGKTYITLQYLSRLALWVYFRNIKIICRTPVPAEGPLLVAANHSNMVLDPIVLIATFPHSRPCHFWALARFFRIPVVGQILKAAGVLPVDTKTHSNAKLFEHTLQSLDRGAVVALFPEGKEIIIMG